MLRDEAIKAFKNLRKPVASGIDWELGWTVAAGPHGVVRSLQGMAQQTRVFSTAKITGHSVDYQIINLNEAVPAPKLSVSAEALDHSVLSKLG